MQGHEENVMKKDSAAILGAGTWGIALARMLVNSGKDITVWSAIPEEVADLAKTNRHPKLPQADLPASIRYTADIKEACADKEIVIFAVPSVYVRSTARTAVPFLSGDQIIVDVAKGIEADTLMTMTEVIRDELTNENIPLVALSGPTHAEEVACDLPSTITAASTDMDAARIVQSFFSTPFMRVYTNSDVKGVELCGALKNIIALAAGISDGLGYGDNAKAALITRGLAELARLGTCMECDYRTFSGLAGMGDLIVTCTSRHSRNHNCGYLIGTGMKPDEAVSQVGMVVEGLNALPAAMRLSEMYQVELPIIHNVNDIVSGKTEPLEALHTLFGREPKSEREFLEQESSH